MKNMIKLGLVAFVALSLSACGNGEKKTVKDSTDVKVDSTVKASVDTATKDTIKKTAVTTTKTTTTKTDSAKK
jgi:uncharacterized protein YcfL